jgi:hypothetical protein
MTEKSEFDVREGQETLLQNVQTGSGTHPACHGYRGLKLRTQNGRSVKLTTKLYLAARFECVKP